MYLRDFHVWYSTPDEMVMCQKSAAERNTKSYCSTIIHDELSKVKYNREINFH